MGPISGVMGPGPLITWFLGPLCRASMRMGMEIRWQHVASSIFANFAEVVGEQAVFLEVSALNHSQLIAGWKQTLQVCVVF